MTPPQAPFRPTTLLLAALIASASGCDRKTALPSEPTAPASSPASSASGPPAATPAPALPHGSGAGEKPLSAEGQTIITASFRFELPAGWRREQPSSGMRLAQAVVPGAGGPGELAVFHFGAGQGGGVESNFDRWLGQIELPPGKPAERGRLAASGFEIDWIDAHGTLLPSTMGSGPAERQPEFRLVGAVVTGPGGPLFFKLTGPESTLEAARPAFFALLQGLRHP